MKRFFYKLLFTVFTLLLTQGSWAQIISTIAGTGYGGYTVDGGGASVAKFNGPVGVVFGAGGTGGTEIMYVSDSANNIVRRIDLGTGIITTFAGDGYLMATGSGAYSGDGGPAVNARLNHPTGLAMDLSGNLLIADMGNHRIRKVNPGTGTINTMCGTGLQGHTGDGGSALTATLNNPYGIKVDGAGNLFIADRGNNCIRKVTAGIITTIAGDTTAGYTLDGGPATGAEFNLPRGVVSDDTGNIFVADYGNNVIRRIDHATHFIRTFAGIAGPGGYGGDGGPATAANLNGPCALAFTLAKDYLFIAERTGRRVRMIKMTGIRRDTIYTLAGDGTSGNGGDGGPATAAQFHSPSGVTVAGTLKHVFIADSGNNRIRRVDFNATTGYFSAIINHYVGDPGGAAGPVSGALVDVLGPATTATLSGPLGISMDPNGRLFVADANHNIIREINLNPAGVGNGVYRYAGSSTGASGYAGDGGYAGIAVLNHPTGVYANPITGDLYIADHNNDAVRVVDSVTLNITRVAGLPSTSGFSGDGGPAIGAKLNTPYGVCTDSVGNVIIADQNNDVIRKVGKVGAFIDTIHTIGGIAGVADYGGRGTYLLMNHPTGMASDGLGSVYIADRSNNLIRRLDQFGVLHTYAGNFGLGAGYAGDGSAIFPTTIAGAATRFNSPVDVCFNSGILYISDMKNNRIRQINTTATTPIITSYTGTGTGGFAGDGTTTAQLDTPVGINFNHTLPFPDLYIADNKNFAVRKVANATGIVTTPVGVLGSAGLTAVGGIATISELNAPKSTVVDAAGNVYIADYLNNVVRKVDPTGIITIFAGTGVPGNTIGASAVTSQLSGPTGLALSPTGTTLYIVDQANNRVVKVTGGVLSNYAGTGAIGSTDGALASCTFYIPTGLSADGSGNLYIADGNNNCVRKIGATFTTLFAGNHSLGYSGDGGPASLAKLNDPKGSVVDATGNVYIADFGNHCVRKVDASGIITTIAGVTVPSVGGTPGFCCDGGPALMANLYNPTSLAFDDSARLLICDYGNHRIRRVDLTTNIITTVAGIGTAGYSGDGGAATSAELNHPYGVSTDASGSIYISDRDNNAVRKIRTGILSSFTVSPNAVVCEDSCITFVSTSIGAIDNYAWSITPAGPTINPTASGATADSITICFTGVTGPFTVRLIVSSTLLGVSDTSSVVVNITPAPHPTAVFIPGTDTLIIHGNYTSYQWYSSGVIMVGQVDSFYEIVANGSYSCIVDSGGCLGTSNTWSNLKVNNINKTGSRFWLTQSGANSVNLFGNQPPAEALKVSIIDGTGRLLRSATWDAGAKSKDIDNISSFPPGLYLIRISNSNTSQVLKWNKE